MMEKIVYKQYPHIEEQQFEEDVLLMHPEHRTVIMLNAAGWLIWTLLAKPRSCAELIAFYQSSFPSYLLSDIQQAVEQLLVELLHAKLIQNVS